MTEKWMHPHQKNLLAIIREIVDDSDIEIREINRGYALDIPVEYPCTCGDCPKGVEIRHQFVFVTYGRKTPGGRDIYQIFTICAPETKDFYRSALMLNMNLPFGAFAVADVEFATELLSRDLQYMPAGTVPVTEVDERKYFVMVDTYCVDMVTVDQMRASIMTAARAGDRLEKLMVGEDLR
ncbi:MAG: hypothetical protein LWY06_08745 [Firmicutes bacterium]|nr:hypothetical protein [Bacillota bacterium]